MYEKQGAPLGAMTFHYHSFYEIIYVLEGEYASMLVRYPLSNTCLAPGSGGSADSVIASFNRYP